MTRTIAQLRISGETIAEADLARVLPLAFAHVIPNSTYFVRQGQKDQRKAQAAKLAEVFQRSSSHVEGRHGSLSLWNHQLRGLDHPRKQVCLTAIHNFSSRVVTGQPPRNGFSGRNLGRCLSPF